MREIKFKIYDGNKKLVEREGMTLLVGRESCGTDNEWEAWEDGFSVQRASEDWGFICQYTGLKDKNGMGVAEVYEGDILDTDGNLIGNIYETDPRETDLVIPKIGTKAWETAYKEAVDRGFDYAE